MILRVSSISSCSQPASQPFRAPIEWVAIQTLHSLFSARREIRNNIKAVTYEKLLESNNSAVSAIKIKENILGVIKVAADHSRAIIEEVKWNIALCLGDGDNFVPTMAWSYRELANLSGGSGFEGRLDEQGNFIVDRGLGKAHYYTFEPFISGTHAPISCRKEWLKTAVIGIVHGFFDGHSKNFLWDGKKAHLIDYTQTMPARNAPLCWGAMLRPFLRLAHMRDIFSCIEFTPDEIESIKAQIQRYRQNLPRLKAYLNAFIVRKKLSYVNVSQFDADNAVKAMEERMEMLERGIASNIKTLRELVFKICPFYKWQAVLLQLKHYSAKGVFDPTLFDNVGNCSISELILKLVKAGIDFKSLVQDFENDLSFDSILMKYKKVADPSCVYETKVDSKHFNILLKNAVFSGADIHQDRELFQLEYYKACLTLAGIKFEQRQNWLYVDFYGRKRPIHSLPVPDKIHIMYRDGNLPVMTFEEFKSKPSLEVEFAIKILHFCYEKRIKVIASDAVSLKGYWAKLKRGEWFVGQIQDRGEFTLYYRQLDGKRKAKKIRDTSDIQFPIPAQTEVPQGNPFAPLEALSIPYIMAGGKALLEIEGMQCPVHNLHGYFVVTIGKAQLRPLSAIGLQDWLKGDKWEFKYLNLLNRMNFILSESKQDLPVVDSYLVQQIAGTDEFYYYTKGETRLNEVRLKLMNGVIKLI